MAKRALFSAVSLLVFVAAAEAACRLYFAAIIGRSVLLYGTGLERLSVSAESHSPLARKLQQRQMRGVGDRNHSARHAANRFVGYAKYYPHQPRSTYDVDTGEVYPVSINAHGFRGPEFEEEKAPGVIRIVTLGASSTFGYHVRDDMTYPAQLQRILGAAGPAKRFEVINLGIPHLTSTQILALFVAEGLHLRPDVVTFYEGFNDASDIDGTLETARAIASPPGSRRLLKRFVRWARGRSLLVALTDAVATDWTERYSAAQIADLVERSRRVFLENLTELGRMSKEAGFIAIVATQQARSQLIAREQIRGVTFEDEREVVSGELAQRGSLGRKEAAFLIHAELLAAERGWAREHDVPLVDLHRALDSRRDTIVSWVHLSREGNRIIAEHLAGTILEEACEDAGRQTHF